MLAFWFSALCRRPLRQTLGCMTRFLSVTLAVVFAVVGGTSMAASKVVASVTTEATGVSADLMESTVTAPIEQALASIQGVTLVRSASSQGKSYVEVSLANTEQALVAVRAALASVRLPREASQPVVRIVPSLLSPLN